MHRRAGKSFYCVCKLIEASLSFPGDDGRFYYVGPSFKQAKAIAFDYLRKFTAKIPGTVANKSELSVEFENGARIQLLGVEDADSLRGRYADGVIMDEAQLMPASVWTYVVLPMLADRHGWGLITGTPAGRHNLLGWSNEFGAGQDDWMVRVLPYDETGAIDPAELEVLRRQMSPEAWRQEMECSFEAALQGAYYSVQMDALVAGNRITRVMHDPAQPVYVALDLGWSDALAIWYAQNVGNSLQIFRYEEFRGMSITALADHWQGQPFKIDDVILPHDAAQHDLGSGKTRMEQLQARGFRCHLGKRMPVHDGIEAARVLLPRCYFDREGCQAGLEALRAYRSEYDERRQAMKLQPFHDWSSHGADAFRYLAIGHDNVGTGQWRPIDYGELRRRSI